jgi:CRISPR-associated protein Cst1
MKLILGDWLTNAGIVGYLRIIQKIQDTQEFDLSKDFIEIDPKRDLEFFADAYCTSVLMRIVEDSFLQSPFHRHIKLKKRGNSYDDIYSTLRKRFIDLENKTFSTIQQSANYMNFHATLEHTIKALQNFKEKSLELFDSDKNNNNDINKQLEKIKKHIDESIAKRAEELQDENQKFLFRYLQKFYQNKAIIGNNSISGSKKNNRKQAFHEKYIEPIITSTQFTSPLSSSFLCRFCKQNYVTPESFSDADSIFNETMFSTIAVSINTFQNFFYNMQSDLFICKICQLLLLCVWVGITQIPFEFRDRVNNTQYIFVNLPSMQLLIDENERIHGLYSISTIDKATRNLRDNYQEIIKHIFEKLPDLGMKSQWVLDNIMFVELRTTARKDSRRPDFRYFHIGKDIANLFLDKYVSRALSKMKGKVKVKANVEINLKRYVISKILAHEPLLDVCHALVYSYLTLAKHQASLDSSILRNIFSLLVILSVRSTMSDRNAISGATDTTPSLRNTTLSSMKVYRILEGLRDEGSMFVHDLNIKIRRQKAHRLDTKARSNMAEEFYHDLVKLYLSVDKSPPQSLITILNMHDILSFQAKALAFLTGFLAEKPASDSPYTAVTKSSSVSTSPPQTVVTDNLLGEPSRID